jgi:hypothetical protein
LLNCPKIPKLLVINKLTNKDSDPRTATFDRAELARDIPTESPYVMVLCFSNRSSGNCTETRENEGNKANMAAS